jgi:ATP-dependent RNA helicase HelY
LFTLDPFQQRAAEAIDRGRSVLVAAPTGAGKTVVAEHAIRRALARERKIFYTTPLKALSNQKFRDLGAQFGMDRTGLLTGDTVVRPEAQIVVMTTEVLRALVYERAPLLEGLEAVVLDEFHYLQDPDRGPVWEEVVMHCPHDVALVCLSATLADLPVLHRWLEDTHGPTELVVEQQRPVTLQFLYAIGNLQRTPPLVLPMFLDGATNPTAELRDGTRRVERGEGKRVRDRERPVTPERDDLLTYLRDGSMLPAIWFVLSRAGCDQAVAACVEAGVRLTTETETTRIRRLVTDATERLSTNDANALDASGWQLALSCGIAAHHGGLAPIQREIVELAAAEGLVKVVFATETLALGVNLPARSVVIDRVSRSGASGGEVVTGAEFAQLAGRAGRRGLDSVGYVVVPWSRDVGFHRVAGLAGGRTEPLRSHFRATPAMAANLINTYGPVVGRQRFRTSLAHHLLDNDLAGMRTVVEERRADLRHLRVDHVTTAAAPAEPSRSDDARDDPAAAADGDAIGDAINGLRVGHVVVDRGRPSAGQLLVVAPPRVRRGQPTIDAVRGDARRVAVPAGDFRTAPVVIGHIDLSDLESGARGFARAAAARLAGARDLATPTVAAPAPPGQEDVRRASAAAIRRLEEEIARLTDHIDDAEGAYDHELETTFDLLRRRGHLDGWTLTASGRVVRRLFHERGLLVAECLVGGVFDGLDVPSTAALLSAFRATSQRQLGPSPFPNAELRKRWQRVETLATSLQRSEADAGLNASPAPDAALLLPIYRWASGATLIETLAGSSLGPGDLAREVKQVIELAEQVVAVAPQALAATTSAVMRVMARGIVVATAHNDDEQWRHDDQAAKVAALGSASGSTR